MHLHRVTRDVQADFSTNAVIVPGRDGAVARAAGHEAIGRRLRRNYLWLFALLALSWTLKVYLHPVPADTIELFLQRAAVGLVPGGIVFMVGFVFNAALFIFAMGTISLREATGEVLPRHQFSLHPLQRMTSWTRAASSVPRANAAAF